MILTCFGIVILEILDDEKELSSIISNSEFSENFTSKRFLHSENAYE